MSAQNADPTISETGGHTDPSDTIAATADSAIDQLMARSGYRPDPAMTGTSDIDAVAGPFLTANLVDAGGHVVACVAVRDVPDPGDRSADSLLTAAAAAAAEDGAGRIVGAEEAVPVATAAEVMARFSMPTTVSVFTDGHQVQALHVSAVDRRARRPASEGPALDGPAVHSRAVEDGTPIASRAAGTLTDRSQPFGEGGLDKLINVSLDVSVELGRTRVTLAEILDYDVGSVVELDRAAGAPVDIRVNDTLLAQGEVVLIDDEYAVRITEIFDPNQQT